MTQTESRNTLLKLRKMIESLQKEEMIQIQSSNAEALSQIVSIARQHSLNAEHIAYALNLKQPRIKKIRVPRKNKKSMMATEPEVVQ
jgi:hypothetical protein